MVKYITPGSSGEPNIVWVFPAPVAPYASTALREKKKQKTYTWYQ